MTGNVGERVRQVRHFRKISAEELGAALLLKQSQMRLLERDEKPISKERLQKIADKLQVTTESLLTGKGYPWEHEAACKRYDHADRSAMAMDEDQERSAALMAPSEPHTTGFGSDMGGYSVDSSGVDCKSIALGSVGATPTPPTIQNVERQLDKRFPQGKAYVSRVSRYSITISPKRSLWQRFVAWLCAPDARAQ